MLPFFFLLCFGIFAAVILRELYTTLLLTLLCRYDLSRFQFLVTKYLVCVFILICVTVASLGVSKLLYYVIKGYLSIEGLNFSADNPLNYVDCNIKEVDSLKEEQPEKKSVMITINLFTVLISSVGMCLIVLNFY